jgi:hypothetical protein
MNINETVLEMHYHKPLMDLFRVQLGLGEGQFNFYKYSPQNECFVGFDQAYVKTDLSAEELFSSLKNDAMNNGYTLSNFFMGYFLQYKVVKTLVKRSRHTPATVRTKPHYRISLDTQKNVRSGVSQHELLYQLNKNIGAMVYYASPMIFDQVDLYDNEPNLELLRLADLNDCPSIYSDNEKHFIYYENIDTDGFWCSDPVEGRVINPKEMVLKIKEDISSDKLYKNQLTLLENLANPDKLEVYGMKGNILDIIQNSLTIIHFKGGE